MATFNLIKIRFFFCLFVFSLFHTGERELDLSELDKPCQNSDHCGKEKKDPGLIGQTLDLFVQKSSRGWWACYKRDTTDPAAPPVCSVSLRSL